MEPNKINQNMIRTIFKKAIRNMKENPKREIRNLIDLGSMFSNGKYQKAFFETSGQELEKEDSLYYKIAVNLVQKTDSDSLLAFGMNLGYNSLTFGAKKIRNFEDNAGFNVPWVLMLEISEHGILDADMLNLLIEQGREMGIYSYMLFISSDYKKMNMIRNVMAGHDDCAFMLFTEPNLIIENKEVIGLGNILIGLNIRYCDDSKIIAATDILREAKVVCVAFYPAKKGEQVNMENAAELAASFQYDLMFILHDYSFYVAKQKAIEKSINYMRMNLSTPILPFDILADVVMIDENISSEGCLAFISKEGNLDITNMDTGERNTDYNITNTPLKTILKSTVPKPKVK